VYDVIFGLIQWRFEKTERSLWWLQLCNKWSICS